MLSAEEFQGWCRGNQLKYLWRFRHKGNLEDLQKSQVFFEWLLESLSQSNSNQPKTQCTCRPAPTTTNNTRRPQGVPVASSTTVARTIYAEVAPLKLLQALWRCGALSSMQLLLAHAVLREPKAWEDFYLRTVRPATTASQVIMDNSCVELGTSVDVSALVEACTAVDADVVVLPDRLGDAEETLRLSLKASARLRRELPHTQQMGVVHGHTVKELEHCYQNLLAAEIEWVGVPRYLVTTMKSRQHCLQMLEHIHAKLRERRDPPRIHLLGFSDNLLDDFYCARAFGVTSIDSAVPLRLGLAGVSLGQMFDQYGPEEAQRRLAEVKRPPNYPTDDRPVDIQQTRILENIQWVNEQLTPRNDIPQDFRVAPGA
jgi:hypothetical protein